MDSNTDNNISLPTNMAELEEETAATIQEIKVLSESLKTMTDPDEIKKTRQQIDELNHMKKLLAQQRRYLNNIEREFLNLSFDD